MFSVSNVVVCISVCVICAHRNNHDVVLQEVLVSSWSGGSIGTFSNDLNETNNTHTHFTWLQTSCNSCGVNYQLKARHLGLLKVGVYLGLDPGSVDTRELLFSGSRDQDVAICFQDAPFVRFGAWEAHNGAVQLQKGNKLSQFSEQTIRGQQNKINDKRKETEVRGRQLCWYQFVVLQLFGVDALCVVDGSINLSDAHTLCSKPVQVPHGVETHITKALWKVNNQHSLK